MHHGFNYEHIVTALCVLIALYAVWHADKYKSRIHIEYARQDEELASLMYLLTDTVEEYRKLMDRSCCWHQKQCPSKGDARILPQVFHAIEVIGKRALPAGHVMSSENAFAALNEQLSIYAKKKYNVDNLEDMLANAEQPLEEGEQAPMLETSSASPRPRGRPRKNSAI